MFQMAQAKFIRWVSGFILLSAISLPALAATKLDPQYKKWLEHDVVYIISRDEKEAFLKLGSDAERDSFIERFWAIRNPDPGAPANAYKDEIYKRLAYVNQWYSTPPGADNG